MPRLFLFFNHKITPRQLARARLELGVAEVAQPPAELSRRWANVPPDEERLLPWMRPVFAWLDEQAAPGDFVLVQGEFGACYLLVRHALDRGLVPVYSTTERHAREQRRVIQFLKRVPVGEGARHVCVDREDVGVAATKHRMRAAQHAD